MPINLTTAFDPGAYDAGNDYAQCKILRVEVDVVGKRCDILYTFGDTPASTFVAGGASRKQRITIQNSPGSTAFDDLVSQLSLTDESAWDCIKRICYSALQNADAALAGTVV